MAIAMLITLAHVVVFCTKVPMHVDWAMGHLIVFLPSAPKLPVGLLLMFRAA